MNTGFIDAEVLKAYIQKSSPLDVSVYEPKGEVSWQYLKVPDVRIRHNA